MKTAYKLWYFTFVLLLISCVLSIVVLANQDVSGKDQIVYADNALYTMGLFGGFVIWLFLLFTQEKKRLQIHRMGLVGFILVFISAGLLFNNKVEPEPSH